MDKKKINNIIQEDVCYKCHRKINIDKERFISLTTHEGKEIVEQVVFHVKCWGEYNSDRFNEHMLKMAGSGMKILKTMGMNV